MGWYSCLSCLTCTSHLQNTRIYICRYNPILIWLNIAIGMRNKMPLIDPHSNEQAWWAKPYAYIIFIIHYKSFSRSVDENYLPLIQKKKSKVTLQIIAYVITSISPCRGVFDCYYYLTSLVAIGVVVLEKRILYTFFISLFSLRGEKPSPSLIWTNLNPLFSIWMPWAMFSWNLAPLFWRRRFLASG